MAAPIGLPSFVEAFEALPEVTCSFDRALVSHGGHVLNAVLPGKLVEYQSLAVAAASSGSNGSCMNCFFAGSQSPALMALRL